MQRIFFLLGSIYRAEHVRVGRDIRVGHFVFNRLVFIK